MDFLTQPLIPTVAPQVSSPGPSTSKDTSSILTTSTTATSDLHHESNAAFAQLRSAPLVSQGLPDEPRIDTPSTKAGDWKAYGKVQATVVMWEDGVLLEKKKLKEELIKESWQVEGTLWFTKRAETILVVDPNVLPEEVTRRTAPKPTRRMSFGRRKSISPTSTRSADGAPANTPSLATGQAVDDPHESTSSGFFTKVLDAIRPGRKERRSSSFSSDGRSLSRSRSRPEATSVAIDRNAPTKPSDEKGQRLTFDEPATHASPFPQYKNHAVSALYVSSPSHIQSVRFYPQRTLSNSSSTDSPLSFLSISKEDQPISSPPASPSLVGPGQFAGGVHIQPPVVELDVVGGVGGDEGRNRDVTVGFAFKEILCATEAEDFHALVEAALAISEGHGVEIHRTVSRSLDTGHAGKEPAKRKSWV